MDEQNNNSNNNNGSGGATDNGNDGGGHKTSEIAQVDQTQGNVNHQASGSGSTTAITSNINTSDVPVPSSPFEIRRHQSFYDGTTTSSVAGNKRKGSLKQSAMNADKNNKKQSTQILNFFRSQSHEPKLNSNMNDPSPPPQQLPPIPPSASNSNSKEADITGDESSPSSGGSAAPPLPLPLQPQEPPPQAKPRRMRPQSLYSKTTSSKGLYVHRVSGIETTPESPEMGEPYPEFDRRSNLVYYTTKYGFSRNGTEESGDEGGATRKTGTLTGIQDDVNSQSGQSSTSSSDSYMSCEGGSNTRRRKDLMHATDKSDLQNYDGDDSCSPQSVDNSVGLSNMIMTISTLNEEDDEERVEIKPESQSGKHLEVGAPGMRPGGASKSGGEGSDSGLPPMTTSKSRQKKFHRHFKTVPPDEKVLDYYSCALVGDILLQGFLYITENYFAFYSNVFGYVTKVLIPVGSVVRITKERTAKIFPNAVGVCTRTEKHVFASLISRDTTFKLMCKVWNFSIEQEAEEIRALQRRVAAQVEAEDAFSADVAVPDESSGDSGSGNDSAMEPSSHSPSPQNTPGFEKMVHKAAIAAIPTSLVTAGTVVGTGVGMENTVSLLAGARIATVVGEEGPISILNYRGSAAHMRASIPGASTSLDPHFAGATSAATAHLLGVGVPPTSTSKRIPQQQQAQQQPQQGGQFRQAVRNLGGRGPSLLVIATALLVILFLSAALLLSRISSLQQKLMERPVIHDSEQFYQDLLSWQTKLHSTTGEEIHQYINSNLQQIVKVRESLEALSMLFVNRPQNQQGPAGQAFGESSSSSILGGGDREPHNHPPDS